MTRLPAVAAVPNYNMGEQLVDLLPGLMTSGYDEIYVLDDGSIDDSQSVVKAISTDIHFVGDGENKGSGATRNRILDALSHRSIIHFVDADTVLDTERSAEVVVDILPNEQFGFVGGLSKTKEGLQTIWNYGPRQSLYADIGAQLQIRIESLIKSGDLSGAKKLHRQFIGILSDWPDPLSTPVRRQVFWAIEQNFVVDSKIFAEIGGFDQRFREHEIQDLAIRMAKCGLKRFFDPSFATTHREINVRPNNRIAAMIKAEAMIARKHGWLNWLMPDGKFNPNL